MRIIYKSFSKLYYLKLHNRNLIDNKNAEIKYEV